MSLIGFFHDQTKLSQMKILMLLLITFTIGCPINSYAADLIVGTVNCKEWVADRTRDAAYVNKSADESWVIGFLSAYSQSTRIKFLADVKAQTIFKWMDKYCLNHPSKLIDDGALILAHELIQQMKK